MATELIGDRASLALLALTKAKRLTIGHFLKSPLLRWRYGGPPIQNLLLIPQELRTCDPSFAVEIEHGYFGLSGVAVNTQGASPFAVNAPNNIWKRELNGFSWLRHLRSGEDALSRMYAVKFFNEWVIRNKIVAGIPWEPRVTAHRIISWLTHSSILLDDTDRLTQELFMKSLTKHIRVLSGSLAETPEGYDRLVSLLALVLSGLCIDQQDKLLDDNLKNFCSEIDRQIVPDGGHISRNSQINCQILLDLLPLKQCFSARHKSAPQTIIDAIQRMLQFLSFMRLGDGKLARFNGCSTTQPDTLGTLLSYDDMSLSSQMPLESSGYTRLEHNNAILIMDTAHPPPITVSGEAHAGCLSFEFSSGTVPILVNNGAPNLTSQQWKLQSRTTSSHNTLTIANSASSEIIQPPLLSRNKDPFLLRGPKNIECSIRENEKATLIRASHDGYADRFGLIHSRRIMLERSGNILKGEDRLDQTSKAKKRSVSSGWPFAIHFHLHPDIIATPDESSEQMNLTLPDGQRWKLMSTNNAIQIEESLYLADIRDARRSIKLVIRGIYQSKVAILWMFEKISA